MTKITLEIDDVLPACVDSAIEQVEEKLREYVADNPDDDETPCLHNDLDYRGDVHEIIDGSVPFRTRDIEAAWYLHGRDLEEAYETSGIGSNPRENNGMAAIYCYIEQRVNEWYHDNADRIVEELRSLPTADGKFRKIGSHGSWVGSFETTLDGDTAVVTFECHKGQRAYWATTAKVKCRSVTLDVVKDSRIGLPSVVKNGFTKREATNVRHLAEQGFVTVGQFAVLKS